MTLAPASGEVWPADDPEALERTGLAVLRRVVPAAAVGAMLARLESLAARGDRLPASYQPEFEPEAGGAVAVRKLRRLYWNDPAFWGGCIRRHGILDAARRLIGERLSLVFNAAFMKPARCGSAVVLHQDQALWSYDYPRAVNIWVALSEVRAETGGLVGIPGAGGRGVLPHAAAPGSFHPGIDWRAQGLGVPEPIDLDPGDLACWDRHFVHGSGPNTSDRPRRGVVFVFVGTECAERGAKDRADF